MPTQTSMPPVSRILAPVDFSERCLGMMPYIRAIAERYAAEVVLLHVMTPLYTIPETGISPPALVPAPKWVLAEKNKQLQDFAQTELDGLQVRRLVYEGDPEAQIAFFAESEAVQLLAMPTHGYGTFRRFLLGSVTSKVLHDVSCPVLTGAHTAGTPHAGTAEFSRIVCAVEASGDSARTLAWAAEMARDFGATLHLIQVSPNGAGGKSAPAANQTWEEVARRDLEKLQDEIGAEVSSICMQTGDIAHEASCFARSVDAQLLITGRQNTSSQFQASAYAIIREAPCPVLSV